MDSGLNQPRQVREPGTTQVDSADGVFAPYSSDRLLAADRLLADQTVAADPRLGLVRCVALTRSGRIATALRVDRHLARTALGMAGAEPAGSADARGIVAATRRRADWPTAPALLRGSLEYGLCHRCNQHAEFAACAAHARRARQLLGTRSPYLTISLDAELGLVAMAQGRVREARRHYRSVGRGTRARFLRDPRLAALHGVLGRELAVERHLLPVGPSDERLAREVYRHGALFAHHAAASELAIAAARNARGADAALSVLDDLWESARAEQLVMVDRLLAALRVSLLAGGGRVAEAERTWQATALPLTDADCVALDTQSWREMEAVACARAAVRSALTAYLDFYAGTDYARAFALVDPDGAMLQHFLDDRPGVGRADTARTLLARLHRHASDSAPRFAGRQLEILRRLPNQRDKEIAAALGLSPDGVRHYLRAIFRKLGVGRRADAVRRARALGVLRNGSAPETGSPP